MVSWVQPLGKLCFDTGLITHFCQIDCKCQIYCTYIRYTRIYISKYIIWYYMFLIVFLNQAWLVSPLLWVGTSQPCDSIAHLLIIKHQSNYHSSSLVAYPKTTANFLPREVFTQSSASLKCFGFPHFESCFFIFSVFFPYQRHESVSWTSYVSTNLATFSWSLGSLKTSHFRVQYPPWN